MRLQVLSLGFSLERPKTSYMVNMTLAGVLGGKAGDGS